MKEYTKPIIKPEDNIKNAISTSALQQSHYVFGTNNACFSSENFIKIFVYS